MCKIRAHNTTIHTCYIAEHEVDIQFQVSDIKYRVFWGYRKSRVDVE